MMIRTHILLVEDDPNTRSTLAVLLEDEGYRVTECKNGAEAMANIMSDDGGPEIDIVVSDLKLPDLSGMDISVALREKCPKAAFILVSGHATLETAVEAVNQGIFSYQVKPLDMGALLSAVRNAFERVVIDD